MGVKYSLDENGPIPEIEAFLDLRVNQKAFQFLTCVFCPAVYGSNFMIDVFAQGKQYVDAVQIFTESDEAFLLFLLEDNWGVWYEAAYMEFKKEAIDMNVEIEHMPERAGTFSDSSEDTRGGIQVNQIVRKLSMWMCWFMMEQFTEESLHVKSLLCKNTVAMV